MGQSGFYCEIDGIDEFTPRRGGAAPRPHAGTLRAQPAHHAPAHAHHRGPRPLRRGGFHGQDRASGHPSAALQPALHARRHGGLLLRLAGPLDGLCHAVRHRTLLQRLLPGPSAAHVARHASPQRPSGEDVRHLPGVPVVGPDHGRSHRRRRQFEGARGRRRRPDQTRRSVPRAQVRLGGRHHLRRPPFARRPHGADLRPLQRRQDHLGQTAGHPAGRAGTEPRADLARRLLRRPRERPRATPTATTTTRRSKPSTWSFSTTIWRA